MFLPAFGDDEQAWPTGLRVVLYLLGLLWLFMGVNIVADVFMGAIEKITSAKKRIMRKDNPGKFITVKVWNDTVANLTLMALGSSAPEILLNVIGLPSSNWFGGDLGPSTIVGSAAFNLFVIIAVCVFAIGAEGKIIKETKVFGITAFSSVFAYVWLLLIVQVITPDQIDIWEGVLTFLFFFILVVVAYLADIGKFDGIAGPRKDKHVVDIENYDENEFAELRMRILKEARDKNEGSLTDEEVVNRMMAQFGDEKVSRAAYRMGAVRYMTGGKKMAYMTREDEQGEVQQMKPGSVADDASNKKKVFVQFECSTYKVKEDCGAVEVKLIRYGADLNNKCTISYRTLDGEGENAAKASDNDYETTSGKLEFAAGESIQSFKVKIFDDTQYETDEHFFIEISDPTCDDDKVKVEVNGTTKAKVMILDDDNPGELKWQEDTVFVAEDSNSGSDFTARVTVLRENGARGEVSVQYHTDDLNAVCTTDYEEVKGKLEFKDGETSKVIEIPIHPTGRIGQTSDDFQVIMHDVEGAKFQAGGDGDDANKRCTVKIQSDAEAAKRVAGIYKKFELRMKKAQVGHVNYKSQFINALKPGGEEEEPEEGEEPAPPPGPMDWVMHIITVFWKLLFACIPPPDYCGGWLCFVIALIMIGVVTAFISDMAELLGCCMGCPASITAITFVALGTSLPDTFASKVAAEQDEYADASVGNVTGSNSVNVFLGIGLPWMIAAIYWNATGITDDWKKKWVGNVHVEAVYDKYKDKGTDTPGVFVVSKDGLGFSVLLFCILACSALGLLVVRRLTPSIGAELGGAPPIKIATSVFLVLCWLIFVVGYTAERMSDLNDCGTPVR